MSSLARLLLLLSVFGSLPAVGIAQGGFPDGTAISLLQWRHFVPRHDEWFDAFAQAWGEANSVAVSIDRVNLAELPAALSAEIESGGGHTIIEMLSSPAAFVTGLSDLGDINQQALANFGTQHDHCYAASYLPAADVYYGFAYGYSLNHGNYDIELWTEAGYPQGPTTYDELLDGGRAIYQSSGIPVGIGISPDLDSEMATRQVIWSFGGSVQDEHENVALNSPATIAAVDYLAQLQNEAMTAEVFGWSGASNNQALVAGEASFIQNPDSAYRSLQDIDEIAAANVGFSAALAGPAGAINGAYISIAVIPAYVEGAQLTAAKQFILDLTANYHEATYHSELFNLPCFPATVAELPGWLEDDPFGSIPADKFAILAADLDHAASLGHPGPTNPAIAQVYAEHIIPNMIARVALGELSAPEAVARAHERVEAIFARWREQGLVGGRG